MITYLQIDNGKVKKKFISCTCYFKWTCCTHDGTKFSDILLTKNVFISLYLILACFKHNKSDCNIWYWYTYPMQPSIHSVSIPRTWLSCLLFPVKTFTKQKCGRWRPGFIVNEKIRIWEKICRWSLRLKKASVPPTIDCSICKSTAGLISCQMLLIGRSQNPEGVGKGASRKQKVVFLELFQVSCCGEALKSFKRQRAYSCLWLHNERWKRSLFCRRWRLI